MDGIPTENKYIISNADDVRRRFPDRYPDLSDQNIQSLEAGDFAQLHFRNQGAKGGEMMWVRISALPTEPDKTYEGVLDNTPFMLDFPELGDLIRFRSENILQILKPI